MGLYRCDDRGVEAQSGEDVDSPVLDHHLDPLASGDVRVRRVGEEGRRKYGPLSVGEVGGVVCAVQDVVCQ